MPDKPTLPPNIGTLQTLRDLLLPEIEEPVFMAISFRGPQRVNHDERIDSLNAQLGFSFLDTKDLSSISKFKTYNFVAGSDAYFHDSASLFRWGKAEKFALSSVGEKLDACLQPYLERNLILVTHDLLGDLAPYTNLYFGFNEIPSVAVLDTYLLARDWSQRQLTLEGLLAKLDCHCTTKYYNAGNDANLTLRALLLLGIRVIGTPDDEEESERVNDLWAIAMRGIASSKKNTCAQKEALETPKAPKIKSGGRERIKKPPPPKRRYVDHRRNN